MDIWSDKKRQSYLCVTVHWVAYGQGSLPALNDHGGHGLLVLKSSLLAFHPLHGKHTGKAIANVVYSLLKRAGVTRHVRSALIILLFFHVSIDY